MGERSVDCQVNTAWQSVVQQFPRLEALRRLPLSIAHIDNFPGGTIIASLVIFEIPMNDDIY